MPKIDINLPPHVTDAEANRIRIVLENELNSKWDIFKHNAQEFFRSLRGLLGSLWEKISNWAQRVWDNLFG